MNYRQIFKWGDKREHTVDFPTQRLLKQIFHLSDESIQTKHLAGEQEVVLTQKSRLDEKTLQFLKETVGAENVQTDDFSRADFSYGKYYLDLVLLRKGIVKNPPDAVVSPRTEVEIEKIVHFCNEHQIPLIPVGAQSSVTRALECPNGGIALNLKKHFTKILEFNEVNRTIKVQSGILGPDLENFLNAKGYTCGHFPQSFEYATVGGWVAASGAGQASTGYGKIGEIVKALKVITPAGIVENRDYPAHAEGWDVYRAFIGSEGTLGVISEVTLQIKLYKPENTGFASFIFKDFETAVTAMREMIQSEYGKPHLFRISDPEETDIAFKTKEFDKKFSNKILNWLGYVSGSRCIMFVTVEGNADYSRFVISKIKQTARKYKGFYIGQKPTKDWLKQRYSSAYMRDPLMDMGIMTDTIETAVTWENLIDLWKNVRIYAKKRPDIVFMTHISHVYHTGANLYFIFLSPMQKGNEEEDYLTFHKGLVDAIHQNGGSLSHHHGIGRALSPWMQDALGAGVLESMKALKKYYDPNHIMNPGGGMLGL